MIHLKKLTLSLRISATNSFIDGTYLHNYILSQMPYLHTFHFDIVTEHVNQQQFKTTPDDIRRTFIERGHNVDCYFDYEYGIGRCHVYSLPFHIDRMYQITSSFPGGITSRRSCLRSVQILVFLDFQTRFL